MPPRSADMHLHLDRAASRPAVRQTPRATRGSKLLDGTRRHILLRPVRVSHRKAVRFAAIPGLSWSGEQQTPLHHDTGAPAGTGTGEYVEDNDRLDEDGPPCHSRERRDP